MVKRVIRTIGKLPTHLDRPPPQIEPIEKEKDDSLTARADMSLAELTRNGGLLPRDTMEAFTRAILGFETTARGAAGGVNRLGRILRSAGLAEGGTVTGRTVSRNPNPEFALPSRRYEYIPPARRLGLDGPEAVIHDANRFGLLYGMSPTRLSEQLARRAENAPIQARASDQVEMYRHLMSVNRVRSIDVPGVTELAQARRLAGERLNTRDDELRVSAATYDAIRQQAASTTTSDTPGDNVSSLFGVPIVVDPNTPPNEIRIVPSAQSYALTRRHLIEAQQAMERALSPRLTFDLPGEAVGAEIRFLDTEASFDPMWAMDLGIAERRVSDLQGDQIRREVDDWFLRDVEVNPPEYRERPNIRNDARQMEAPHARFLEENARYSTRRRRR